MGAVGGRDGAPRALAGGRIASSRRHPIVKPMVKTGQRAAQGEGRVSRPAHIVETRNFALHFPKNDLKGCMTRAAPVDWCQAASTAQQTHRVTSAQPIIASSYLAPGSLRHGVHT